MIYLCPANFIQFTDKLHLKTDKCELKVRYLLVSNIFYLNSIYFSNSS